MSVLLEENLKELTVNAGTTTQDLRKCGNETLKNIKAHGFLHRKQNFVDWVNRYWDCLAPKGVLWIRVPNGSTCWNDPFAMRELNAESFSRFDAHSETHSGEFRPFQVVACTILGNDLLVRMIK